MRIVRTFLQLRYDAIARHVTTPGPNLSKIQIIPTRTKYQMMPEADLNLWHHSISASTIIPRLTSLFEGHERTIAVFSGNAPPLITWE